MRIKLSNSALFLVIWCLVPVILCLKEIEFAEEIPSNETVETKIKQEDRGLEVKFRITPTSNVFSGQYVVLTCTIKFGHWYNETIEWYKDTDALPKDDITTDYNPTMMVMTLIIQNANVKDSGMYGCEVFTKHERLNARATLKVVQGIGKNCTQDSDCVSQVRAYCDDEGYCRCREGFVQSKTTCIVPASSKSQEIYKAAMVALACFMVTIIGLFVMFLCNKSFLRRGSTSTPLDDLSSSRRSSDLFNVAEGLAAMRHVDKPPTYQQVVAQEIRVRGLPPPSYAEVAPTFDTSTVQRPARVDINTHRPLTRINRTGWPRDQDSNLEPAILNLNSSQILERHADRGHINLARSLSNGTSGSINSAFVSDA